jgi:A/G-specific adenine glycosylase
MTSVLNASNTKAFKRAISKTLRTGLRSFPWRDTHDPYKIMVSEFMLQQTQTSRVVLAYQAFLHKFPEAQSLAEASVRDVLTAWQGLGYNRRALYLKESAQVLCLKYQGVLPCDPSILQTDLPGVGSYTAHALCVFSYNVPFPMVETNIRTVLFNYFFHDSMEKVADKELLKIIAQLLDNKSPRHWYYALMDCGVELKSQGKGRNTLSNLYVKQTKFEGSFRQLRAEVLRVALEKQEVNDTIVLKSLASLSSKMDLTYTKKSVGVALNQLCKEGFFVKKGLNTYRIKS